MRGSVLPWTPFVLAAACLALPACSDDGGSSDGSSSAGTADSGPGPVTSDTGQPVTDATSNGNPTSTTDEPDTSADSSGDSEDSTGNDPTTGGVPACPYDAVDNPGSFGLEMVANGCDRPIFVIGHPTQPDRLYVVEQGGEVRIVEPGTTTCGDVFMTTPSTNQSSATIGNESGLLGFAFHPNFPEDGRVYVNYNPSGGGSTVVEEYTVDAGNPDVVDQSTARTVIEFCQPAGNHNGGALEFDNDGMLLISTGDGGPQNDGLGNGHNPSQLLAKILRIDVTPDGVDRIPEAGGCLDLGTQASYGIPDDNPFLADGAFTPETYAWGFRNPWRMFYDRPTGDLYVGDVGQGAREEVTIVVPGTDGGWSNMEGAICGPSGNCETGGAPGSVNGDGHTLPITDYSNGCSVIAGAVYRSCEVPSWDGLFFYGDYCSGQMGSVVWDGADVVADNGFTLNVGESIIGNGYNAWGDVYITTVNQTNGVINDGLVYRVIPQ